MSFEGNGMLGFQPSGYITQYAIDAALYGQTAEEVSDFSKAATRGVEIDERGAGEGCRENIGEQSPEFREGCNRPGKACQEHDYRGNEQQGHQHGLSLLEERAPECCKEDAGCHIEQQKNEDIPEIPPLRELEYCRNDAGYIDADNQKQQPVGETFPEQNPSNARLVGGGIQTIVGNSIFSGRAGSKNQAIEHHLLDNQQEGCRQEENSV